MKTITIGNFVGFEITTIQEVVKAQACGLVITDKDGGDYHYEFEDEDENGDVFDREPTDKEVFDRIAEDIANGHTLVAGFWLDTDKVQVVPRAAITLQTDFHIGQEVYTMRNNKIIEAKVHRLWLTQGGETYFKNTDYLVSDIVREMRNCVTTLSANKATLNYIGSRIDDYKAMEENMAYLVNKEKKLYKLVKLSDVFATKEELVKHLMEE
nr:hypothetical protein [uncultured Prevotella sp.]